MSQAQKHRLARIFQGLLSLGVFLILSALLFAWQANQDRLLVQKIKSLPALEAAFGRFQYIALTIPRRAGGQKGLRQKSQTQAYVIKGKECFGLIRTYSFRNIPEANWFGKVNAKSMCL